MYLKEIMNESRVAEVSEQPTVKNLEKLHAKSQERKNEILKTFMDKSATDWYGCTLFNLTIEAE